MDVLQRWAGSLPPVLGIVGVLFATPLMVVVMMILVRRLYIEDFLEQRTA